MKVLNFTCDVCQTSSLEYMLEAIIEIERFDTRWFRFTVTDGDLDIHEAAKGIIFYLHMEVEVADMVLEIIMWQLVDLLTQRISIQLK